MAEPIEIGSLSDDQLRALIAAGRGPSVGEHVADVGRGAAVGAREAAANLAGTPGDLQSLLKAGVEYFTGPQPPNPNMTMPGSATVRARVEELTGPLPEPKY